MHVAELTEISKRLRARLQGEPSDPLTLAHCAGCWLEPRLGQPCKRIARRVVYDPSEPRQLQAVAREAVRVLLQAEGFDASELGDDTLDTLALQLIHRPTARAHALSA